MAKAEHIAFVAPRFAKGSTVGGAETLLKHLAMRAAGAGRQVTFLTTCATNHFTWENDLAPGKQILDDIPVHFFPVDDRPDDLGPFLRAQESIARGCSVPPETERLWLEQNVNSRALLDHLREHGKQYDRIVMGPYLFGLIYFAAQVYPDKTVLVPCLHDEPFAYLPSFQKMFESVGRIIFNAEPERDLATRIFDPSLATCAVAGMGIDPRPLPPEPGAFARRHGLTQPYILYCGRREALKGTPILLDYWATFRSRTGEDIRLVLTGRGDIDVPPGMQPYLMDVGMVPEDEKFEAMAEAMAFCHPSVNESLGIVILESWLMETPVLVHAGSAVLQHQCRSSNAGLWFRTYAEFEEELLLLINNPELRSRMGKAGRAYVETTYAPAAVDERFLGALDKRRRNRKKQA